jgi:PAS domain S-box-containing protein
MDQVVTIGHPKPLDDIQRRLEAVLNNASVSIILMDDRQRCIFMNRAAEELTGFTFEEVLALDKPLHDIIHHTHPDGRPFPLSECVIDRAFPEYNQVQGEEVFVHKDGNFYPVAFTASPIRDEASKTIGTIIEVRNTTAEKVAEERQKLLMNELNHRVKNTLATVQSVAWQTFKDVDPAAVDRFMGRLSILSRAHNILTGTAWHKAALAEVVNTAVEPFGTDRFDIEGPDCDVHPKVAVSLSMVLHELGTNAAKYGALSEPGGRVSVQWRCEGKEEATLVDLVWEESGGPPVEKPVRKGFGTRLIERQLRLEFGGSAKLEFLKDGFVCRIHLEMPANPEPLDVHLMPAAR